MTPTQQMEAECARQRARTAGYFDGAADALIVVGAFCGDAAKGAATVAGAAAEVAADVAGAVFDALG